MKLVVQNSFSRVEGLILAQAEDLIRQVLTYKNDIDGEKGQLFYQLKLAKRHGNKQQYHATLAKIKHLEQNEYVCLYKDKTFPTGLLNIVQEALRYLNYDYEFVDERERPDSTVLCRWNNEPWAPRYYQKNMIDLGIQHGRGVFVSAVGTGKSLIMAYLIKAIPTESLVIVPSVGLSGQLYNDFSTWFGHKHVQLLDAAKIRKMKKASYINIVTVQSLASLKKTGEFAAFAKKINAVYGDEIHHAGASSYTKLLPDLDHVFHRFGFTGTFLRNDNKLLEMWSFLSNVLYEYPAHQAIQEKFLTPLQVHVHQIEGKKNRNYQKEYDENYCGDSNLLRKIHELCEGIDSTKQILILVNRKDKAGLIIHEYLNALGIDNAYISGDNSKEEINGTISDFNDKKIRILIGSSVIGEGIDVRSTDHIIMCQGGKSEITMVQAIGRAIRLYDGKDTAYAHDFRFTGTQYMEKHLEERLEVYQRNFGCQIYE